MLMAADGKPTQTNVLFDSVPNLGKGYCCR